MKKLATLISILALGAVFATAGCKKKEEAAPAPKAEEKKPEEAKPAEAKPAEAKPEEAKPADPAAAAAPAGSTGIPECDAWVAAADKLAKCDKIAKEAADGYKTALEGAKAGWASLAQLPADQQAAAKTAAAGACKTSADGIDAALKAAGCQ